MSATKRPTTTTPATPERRLRSPEHAGEYADVSDRTIRRWVEQGYINGYRAGRKLLRVDLNEIDQMMRGVG